MDQGKYVAIFFNTQKNSATADKTLRQALAYAINKKGFEEIRAISPISPNSWAYNPQVKPYKYDPKRAKELIGTLPKELKNTVLKISTTPILMSLADKIADDWRLAGINTSVQAVSGVPETFDAFLAVFDIPKDPDQYALWHSNQDATNLSNYSNPRIDKLLEDGRTQIDTEVRKKIYLDFQRFLMEDIPAVFLYHPILYTISRK
jgi:peptide/nickel transport system substrate-binding protein